MRGIRKRHALRAGVMAGLLAAAACTTPATGGGGSGTTTTAPGSTTTTTSTTTTSTTSTSTTTTSTSTTTTSTTTTTIPTGPVTTHTAYTMNCRASILFITQDHVLDLGVTTTAPASVTAGSTFQIQITPDDIAVPTEQAGYAVTSLSNITARFPVPANSTFVGATLVEGTGYTGTSTVALNGSNIELKIPGSIAAATTATLPTVTVTLQATGTAGSSIDTTIYGSSYGNWGYKFNVAISLGTTSNTCYPAAPVPTFSTTLIV